VTITYASEVCPVALRGYLTTYVNFCWGLGQVIGIGVIKSMLPRKDEWAYRIPYALQWMWPVPLLIGVALAPESPWWLVRRGRMEDARRALLRLTSLDRETDFDADETLAMMQHTTMLEEKITRGATYWDCFKGTDLRRTEVCCVSSYTDFSNKNKPTRSYAWSGPCKTSPETPSRATPPTSCSKPVSLRTSPTTSLSGSTESTWRASSARGFSCRAALGGAPYTSTA
jgi:hypothetical protein